MTGRWNLRDLVAFKNQAVFDGFPLSPLEAYVNSFAASLLARLTDVLATLAPRREPIAIPIRRDDGCGPRRGNGRI